MLHDGAFSVIVSPSKQTLVKELKDTIIETGA